MMSFLARSTARARPHVISSLSSLLLSQITTSLKISERRTGARSTLPRVTRTADTRDGSMYDTGLAFDHLGHMGFAMLERELCCASGGEVTVVVEVGAARRLEPHAVACHAPPQSPVLKGDIGEPSDLLKGVDPE